MANSYKAIGMARSLNDVLSKRLPTLNVRESFDTDGNPLILVGAGTAGQANAVIKVKAISWPLAKDILGLDSTVYVPHVVQLCTEANFAGTTDNVADTLNPQQLLDILTEVTKLGSKVEWYQTASGTAPTAAGITGSNLKASIDPNLYWPMIASQ